MSAVALVAGSVYGKPITRPTRTGGQVTFIKLRVVNGAQTEWWDIVCFDPVREELVELGDGDALSAIGALSTEIFEYRGEHRIRRRLTADRVLTLKRGRRSHAAARVRGRRHEQETREYNDKVTINNAPPSSKCVK